APSETPAARRQPVNPRSKRRRNALRRKGPRRGETTNSEGLMTQIEETIVELWEVLRADSPLGVKARRRAAATSALAVSVLARLVAVGLAGVVLVIVAMVSAAGGLLAAAALLRRHRGQIRGLSARLRMQGSTSTRRMAHAAGDWSRAAAARSVPVA